MNAPYEGDSNQNAVPGLTGRNTAGGRGVAGFSDTWQGVYGHSGSQAGVVGESDGFDGVWGVSHSPPNAGVSGHHDQNGYGVWGGSNGGRGVAGFSDTWQGVYGHSGSQAGVVGESDGFDGVWGVSHNPQAAGVSGHNPGGLAGFFDGNVTVTGDISLPGADCAEEFAVVGTEPCEPGTVMVISADGEALQASQDPYDRKVVGVISGAGNNKPGITLDKRPSAGQQARMAIGLIGKVYCKVDADISPISVGDLLTTSATPGHAMKATDQTRAFGAVIGKALQPQTSGRGLIPIVVALQ
ncbi:MAG TPA: hypothetical protein VFQ44_02565 [Streptosporangiaceae bacterium]|nr:hypothetical protein [Streptosporangiaceae bacterium]